MTPENVRSWAIKDIAMVVETSAFKVVKDKDPIITCYEEQIKDQLWIPNGTIAMQISPKSTLLPPLSAVSSNPCLSIYNHTA